MQKRKHRKQPKTSKAQKGARPAAGKKTGSPAPSEKKEQSREKECPATGNNVPNTPPEYPPSPFKRKNGTYDKRARFVDEYLKDLDAPKAYARAGYKPKNQNVARVNAHRLLMNAMIAEEIRKRQEIRAARCQISAENVLKRLWKLGTDTTIGEIASWTYNGTLSDITLRVRHSDELTEEQLASIREIKETKLKDGRTLSVKLRDPVPAIELVGKHLGMFQPKPEKTDPREEAEKWRAMIREMDEMTIASPATGG